MNVIKDFLRKAVLLKVSVFWQKWLNDEGNELRISLQQHQLEKENVDSTNEAIGFYSSATEILSGGEKKAGDPFNMHNTGNFLGSFDALPFTDKVELFADDESIYDVALTEKYGIEIINLTDENKNIYKKSLKEYILENFKNN